MDKGEVMLNIYKSSSSPVTGLEWPTGLYIKAQTIKWHGYLNRMEDIKLVKKITDWNPIGVRTKGQPMNRWRDEVLNDFSKLKLRNWIQLFKDRKA